MKPALIDVSVLLIFFNRPEVFGKVFEQVKLARPSRLFLYQDGARNEKDYEGIKKCREIAEEIDWECEVYTKFQDKNFGCDPSEYIAQKWAFTMTDKCIVIEDDDVPSQSFFPFCKEMLDRYEKDTRVWMVSGFNHEEITQNVNSDYFFTEFMSIWGWATWKRVVDTWDSLYSFLDEKKNIEKFEFLIKENRLRKDFIKTCQKHRESGKEHYETILWASMILNSGLAVMPKYNLINNIGTLSDSTHFSSSAKMLPRGYRKIFTMPRYDLSFPLNHPEKIVPNHLHLKNVYKINGWNHPWIKVGRSLEELVLNLRYGNLKNISKSIKKRLKKIFNS